MNDSGPDVVGSIFFLRNKERNCGNYDVIPATADNHGEFNGILATNDEVVLSTPANNYSSADIFLDQIFVAEYLWFLLKKSRIRLHNYWMQKSIENAEELHHLSKIYKEVYDG